MPIPVHALAHRPLTAAAVAEFMALPAVSAVTTEAVDAEMRRRGWGWEHQLVCESVRTGSGYVLCTEGYEPFGRPAARRFLVFGEIYPVNPADEEMTNGPWLYEAMDDWQQIPGWSGRRPGTLRDCEDVLTHAAQAVTDHLRTPPERAMVLDTAYPCPALTHRVWRTDTHALVLGPAGDNGPYGYLTHLQLSCTPLTCGPELPAAGDKDGLEGWITAHVDW